MLAQFEWARVGEMTVAMVPVVGLPLSMMVFYLRSLRKDLTSLETRVADVEQGKVGLRAFVVKSARTGGKLDQVWDRLGQVGSAVAEIKGRLEGELGTARRMDGAADRIVAAIAGTAKEAGQ